ncbi:lipid asymmetry maintenance protein MlaB [Vibrio tapetis subsp. quintayensis]|uniref:STAS domain-containing protein n=1 Tax=Vibrio tapetis TaxID=52443 RepID=UPI0025B43AC2|nr:lipid asymmetry maintenance protein MlaB [Vibrio tapetis]MDN3680379.1 lipid asymmetry maintenance protein MlaB [Vibrio tapetis subsp. quintayensis]
MVQRQWNITSEQGVQLSGDLDRESVPGLWRTIQAWQPSTNQINLNLSLVQRVDSAGMVMLIHLLEHAKKQNCHIMFSFVPEQLHTLCRLSNVESILLDHIES